MYKTFIKNSEIRMFEVENNKVLTTVIIDNYNVTNPTLEQFLSIGWKEYIAPEPPTPEPYLPTIEELVEGKLRERYSLNKEFEVQRKRDVDISAFQNYYNYVEECIAWANEQPHRDRNTDE